MIKAILFMFLFSQIKEIVPQNELQVKIQTSKEDNYYLLTKKEPLEIKVDGPTWLRVYTRIPWPADVKGTKIYKLILEENDLKERFITMETERSSVAKLAKIRLSKWRSFYINVPKGMNTYRFLVWSGPSDSVLMRFAYESPKNWLDVTPAEYNAKLELAEDERIINYFEAASTRPVVLEIEGPKKLQIISRLNYSTIMEGEQFYSITVKENNKIVKNISFRAHRSETTNYRNRKEIIPSNPHTFYLNIRKGRHRLEFYPGAVESCGFRFRFQEK